MATNLQQLQTIKAQVLANLAELTLNPKPTYTIDGVSIPWTEYHQMLLTQLSNINDLLVVEGGPFVFVTQATS